jgi:tRNA pseudouridine55 synthase
LLRSTFDVRSSTFQVEAMHGVLVIDKPNGPTSHDIVAAARRILREKRIGHTGTLDPMATGVLPLVIGKATRLAALLSGSDKQYEAGVRLGCATATYDAAERLAEGLPPPAAPDISPAAVEDALAAFRGEIQQVPPPYSAKKIAGKRAYELARSEQPVELKPVAVTVRQLEIAGYREGLLTLVLTVSAGFYVRSLAHDLGVRLGCGAHLEWLRRTQAAGFGVADAVGLDALQADPKVAAERLVPMARLASHLPGANLTESGRSRAAHGNTLFPHDFAVVEGTGPLQPGDRVRLLGGETGLLGIAILGPDGLLRPSVVLV